MQEYLDLPMNRFNGVFGYVLRNGTVVPDERIVARAVDPTEASMNTPGEEAAAGFVLDLAFRAQEILGTPASLERYSWRVSDVGDVSTFGSYDEFDAEGFEIRNMKVFPEIFANVETLLEQDWRRLLRQGYGYFRVYALDPDRVLRDAQHLPFRVLLENQQPPAFPRIGGDVALSLQHQDGRHYVFANGQLLRLDRRE